MRSPTVSRRRAGRGDRGSRSPRWCALAPSIEWLWFGRALQGLSGGAGIVVGRAVVRDLHEGPQAQRLMSRVMLIFALAPALAPMLARPARARRLAGDLLLPRPFRARARVDDVALPARDARGRTASRCIRRRLRAYPVIFRHPAFMLLALGVALNFNGFFPTLGAGVHPRASEPGSGGFVWLFGPAVGG